MKLFLMSVLMMTAAIQTVSGGEVKFQSREGQRVRLVELYTSEGCSSCPPAESWLSRLKDSPQLWTEVVPVAFHVDYWDNLGWRDRFAAPAWTARQRAYAAAWGSDSVYTPGFVLDGREWQEWSGATVPAAGKTDGAGWLSVTVRDRKTATVVYRPGAGGAGAAREVSVALLGSGLGSDVKAGENRGRSLRHDFVALACETKKLSAVTGQPSEEGAMFELPAPLTTESGRLALAVWVGETGRVSQAAGGWLD